MRRRYAFLLVVMILGTLAGVGSPAYAHKVEEAPFVWQSSDNQKCVRDRVSIGGDTHHHLYTRTRAEAFREHWYYNCIYSWERAYHQLAVRTDLYYWGQNRGQWLLCGVRGWNYNTYPTANHGHDLDWGEIPCGRHYYANLGGAYTHWNNVWNGGWQWSGYHWFG